jgi:hypothetical protein
MDQRFPSVPSFLKSRNLWVVNIPKELSDTGTRRQLFFETKGEATTAYDRLKARRDNFGTSLTAITPAKIAEAVKAYNLLDPLACIAHKSLEIVCV